MQRYFNLYKIVLNWKGKESFTTAEFSIAFFSSQPRKVLYDLSKLGLIEKIKRNSYKAVQSADLVKEDYFKTIKDSYELLKKHGLKYSLTRTDAVLKWTKGGYNANRFFGFYPIEIKVKPTDLGKWVKFFKNLKRDFVIYGKPSSKTLFGVFYILYPKAEFKIENLEGEPVDSLQETIEFCQRNLANFEHALAMLDNMYSLKLSARY